jgi:hypothetical protein
LWHDPQNTWLSLVPAVPGIIPLGETTGTLDARLENQ